MVWSPGVIPNPALITPPTALSFRAQRRIRSCFEGLSITPASELATALAGVWMNCP
jgi:hypothetical protein